METAVEITRSIEEWRAGRGEALDELMPYIYGELREMAGRALRQERPGHTLQPTALVHEVYLRLAGKSAPPAANRRHFYGIAARLMRQILVDHARRRLSEKRGGERAVALPLEESLADPASGAAEFTALDQALDRLAEIDERKARAVELRYFTGLTVEEIADATGMSPVSVYRDLAFANAFLSAQLEAR
jgi:RNA polymerase sigma factor (TIGR02999 family)